MRSREKRLAQYDRRFNGGTSQTLGDSVGFFKEFKKALRDQLRTMGGVHPHSKKRSNAKPANKKPPSKKLPTPVVRVEYLNVYSGPPSPTHEARGGFAYYWRVIAPPKLGQRVLAPVHSGYWEEAIVIGFGRDGYSGRLKSITRTAQ